MPKGSEIPVRLAMRQEGSMVNAYIAYPNSMNDAVLIGSIAVNLVNENEARWKAFKSLMSECVADLIEQQIGTRPAMEEREAPEHEKATGIN